MNDNAFRLQMQSGPNVGHVYELTRDSLTLGRYPLADIVIDDPTISYRHAVLTRDAATYRIADLGSDAGTYVNGRRVGAEPVALSPGDVILLGPRLSAAFLSGSVATAAADDDEESAFSATDAPPSLSPEPSSEQPHEPEAAPFSTDDADNPSVEEGEEPPVEPIESGPDHERPAPTPADVRVAPGHAGPLPAMPPPQKNRNGRIALITAGCLIALLACCCSSTLFMYFIGGDWLLSQLGYLP